MTSASTITSLTDVGGTPDAADYFVMVDVSDTSMAPTGTNKKVTYAELGIAGGDVISVNSKTGVVTLAATDVGAIGTTGSAQFGANAVTASAALTPGTSSAYTFADATSGAISLTLGSTSTPGYLFVVKKIDSSANSVTIDAGSGHTIDGVQTKVISAQYGVAKVMSSSTSGVWYLV